MIQAVIEVIGISRNGLKFDSNHRRPGRSGNAATSQSAERPVIAEPDAGKREEGFHIAAISDALAAFAIHENHNSHKRFATSIFIFLPPGAIALVLKGAIEPMAPGKNLAGQYCSRRSSWRERLVGDP